MFSEVSQETSGVFKYSFAIASSKEILLAIELLAY